MPLRLGLGRRVGLADSDELPGATVNVKRAVEIGREMDLLGAEVIRWAVDADCEERRLHLRDASRRLTEARIALEEALRIEPQKGGRG